MLTSGLVFRALASLLVGYIAMAMRPPRASPSREIHGASRDHYAPDEALGWARGTGPWAWGPRRNRRRRVRCGPHAAAVLASLVPAAQAARLTGRSR